MTTDTPRGDGELIARGRRNGAAPMCWIFIVFGVVMIGVGSYFTATDARFLATSVAVQGHVVDYTVSESRAQDSNRIEYSYKRSVRYTVDGVDYTREEDGGSSSEPTIGDAVTVYYSPAEPANAMVDTLMRKWLGPIGIAAGIVWIGLWVAILRFTDRNS